MRQKGLITMENMNLNEEVVETEDLADAYILDEADEMSDKMLIATDQIAQKCREIKELCAKTATRLADDWRETNGNPYIRQTRTCKIEIFRNANDETPVDTFQMTDVKSYSARALAIATGVAAVIYCASGSLVRKLLTPGD